MAISIPGPNRPCPLCGRPLEGGGGKVVGFPFIGSRHPIVRKLDDAEAHGDRLNRWEHRDEFVKAWNREAEPIEGLFRRLRADRRGRVRALEFWAVLAWAVAVARRLVARCRGPWPSL